MITESSAIQRHLFSVNDYYRLHLRPQAGEKIKPLLLDEMSIDWQGLFADKP